MENLAGSLIQTACHFKVHITQRVPAGNVSKQTTAIPLLDTGEGISCPVPTAKLILDQRKSPERRRFHLNRSLKLCAVGLERVQDYGCKPARVCK